MLTLIRLELTAEKFLTLFSQQGNIRNHTPGELSTLSLIRNFCRNSNTGENLCDCCRWITSTAELSRSSGNNKLKFDSELDFFIGFAIVNSEIESVEWQSRKCAVEDDFVMFYYVPGGRTMGFVMTS